MNIERGPRFLEGDYYKCTLAAPLCHANFLWVSLIKCKSKILVTEAAKKNSFLSGPTTKRVAVEARTLRIFFKL